MGYKNKSFVHFSLTFVIVTISMFSRAQETTQLLNNLMKEDSTAVTALALYPANVRTQMLEACTHPEALVRIEALQKNTAQNFKAEMTTYNQDDQQKIWDLVRYPGLIAKISEGGKKSPAQLEAIKSGYPSEISETIDYIGLQHYPLVVKVHSLLVSNEKAFETIIKDYPENTKSALRELIKYPEAINILTSNMRMSVLAGDIYKKQPQLIQHKLDSISIQHAEQNARDFEEWKSGLEKNPEAKKEMEASAREFAKEQGYSDTDMEVNNQTIVVNYVCHPYPYWFGYPYWYDYPYWYPYPYWYDWGFYWGPYGMVYIGFPSPYFTHWYFHHHHHHYHYPHFSDYCVGHYYGHRKSLTGFNSEVSHWMALNELNLPQHFFVNDAKRVDRIKEFGKFEMDYQEVVVKNPGKNITREDYLKSNSGVYPNLKPVLTEPNKTERKEIKNYEYKRPAERPVYTKPKDNRPPVKIPREPKSEPKKPTRTPPTNNPPRNSKGKRGTLVEEDSVPKDNFGKINEAQEYHRSKWNGK